MEGFPLFVTALYTARVTVVAPVFVVRRLQPIFAAARVADLKRMPSRKAAPAVNPML